MNAMSQDSPLSDATSTAAIPDGTVILENACGMAVVDLRGARVVSWRPHGTGEAFGAGGLACPDPAVMRCRFHVAGRRDVNRFWSELSLVGEVGPLRLSVLVRLAGGLSVAVSATNSTDEMAVFRASLAASFAVSDPARCLFEDLATTFRVEGLPQPDVAPDYRLASPSARFFLRDPVARRVFIMSGAGANCVRATSSASVEYAADDRGAESRLLSPGIPRTVMLSISIRDEAAMPIDASGLRRETGDLQGRIDALAASGGGTLSIPPGVHLSGALFFKPGVNLHLEEGAVLLGAGDAADYPMRETRVGCRTLHYYPALVNADHCDGFRISGPGIIDGNGLSVWREFWKGWKGMDMEWRRNTDGVLVRPRLVYVSNSNGVEIADATLRDSRRWTLHLYRCRNAVIRDCRIECRVLDGVHGPSTDAIDLDACSHVAVRRVFMNVNDDGVVLKGGRGPWADDPVRHPENGPTSDVLVEDCVFGTYCHSCLTLGSECIGAERVVVRRCLADQPGNLVHIKMRTDTHFTYRDILVEDCLGILHTGITALPWTQFADLEGRTDLPRSLVENVKIHCPALHAERTENCETPDYCDIRGISIDLGGSN